MVATLLSIFSAFVTDMTTERTFIMVKPDGVQRGLVGEIIKRFETRGYKLVACKMLWAIDDGQYKWWKNKPGKEPSIQELLLASFFTYLYWQSLTFEPTQTPGEDLLKKHYAELADKPFFPKLITYMRSGPCVPMVWEGREAVKMGRMMLGATNPLQSNPGTIRGDFCIDVGRNICHGSDGVETAKREIDLWFQPNEITKYESHSKDWVYE